MKEYVHYEDIPKAERKRLAKEEFKKDHSVRLWQALTSGLGTGVSVAISGIIFPDKADFPKRLILGTLICSGFVVFLYQAAVKPRIKHLVERIYVGLRNDEQ
jgi:hypothetical protein